MRREGLYPFVAVVGQQRAKQALLMALVNPKAGGLLIGGPMGTGKSILARSVLDLVDCQLVQVPLNATEDMLFGSLDLEAAVHTGAKSLMPGLLARAHGSLMYIDDVNLLPGELLSPTLEAVVGKRSLVERDGLSCEQVVETTILATMNPEEGTLSPQLLDRFGMYVEMEPLATAAARVEVIKRQLAYSRGIEDFRATFRQETASLRAQIAEAKALLPTIRTGEPMVQLAAALCAKACCAGHRADIYLLEGARALAALGGRAYVLPKDVEEAAQYVLAHRAGQPPEGSEGEDSRENTENSPEDSSEDKGENSPEENREDSSENGSEDSREEQTFDTGAEPNAQEQQGEDKQSEGLENNQEGTDLPSKEQPQNREDNSGQPKSQSPGDKDRVADIAKGFTMPRLLFDLGKDRRLRRGSGKRSLTKTDLKQGRYVRAQYPKGTATDLAFDATLRAAAPYQRLRPFNGCAVNITKGDLRQKLREKRIGTAFLFAVDASGSMGARERMQAVKGAIFSLLQEAYQKRDRVGMIAFRRRKAEVLLPITRSIDLAQKSLAALPTGGKTPLADGLALSLLCLYKQHRQEPELEPIYILITDGRANVVEEGKDPVEQALGLAEQLGRTGATCIVIDTETDFIKLGIAQRVAKAMKASYFKLKELSGESLIRIVRQSVK